MKSGEGRADHFGQVSRILCAVSVAGGLAAAAVATPDLLWSAGRVFLEGCGVEPGWSSASRSLFFLKSWKFLGAPASMIFAIDLWQFDKQNWFSELSSAV